MNLLFIQGGSRLKQAEDGRWFTDPNFTSEVWQRYMDLCDRLTIVLRKERNIYSAEEAERRFNVIPISDKVHVIALDDITIPKYNLVNPFVRHRIKKEIHEAVRSVDKCIIRSASFYTQICMEACLQYVKPYLFEVTGFALEGMSHHSLLGKLSAQHFENLTKKLAANAESAIYVTEEALQKRYPCKVMLGCSDVVIPATDEVILKQRLQKIETRKNRPTIVIGTAAFLDVKWKGQENVIRALAYLKKKGITNFKYELVGAGTGERLKTLSEGLGVSNQIIIRSVIPHDKVFTWLDSIDIYVQPSYQEGLCRIIVEAMSRACPVICSDTGGNYELIDRKYIFECGDYRTLGEMLLKIDADMEEQAMRNFEYSKHYHKEPLDKKRNTFLKEFVQCNFIK